MREQRLTQAHACARPFMVLACSILFTLLFTIGATAQCVPSSGTLSGTAFLDNNSVDGVMSNADLGISSVLVSVYDRDGEIQGTTLTDDSGYYILDGLDDDTQVRVQFSYPGTLEPTFLGVDNGSNVQFTTVPSCNVSLGLLEVDNKCPSNPNLIATCFAQGTAEGANRNLETIVGIEHDFNNNSTATKYASMGETGSIWGMAWKNTTKEIFTSSFVKQYTGLKDGHDAIFKTVRNGSEYETTVYTHLTDLGVNIAPLDVTDIFDCNYGAQAGKKGLGPLVLSPDEEWLYTINLSDNTLVKMSSFNPTAATTSISQIPDPGCGNGDYRAFALVFKGLDLYIGVTCTAETSYLNGVVPSQLENESSANVYKYNTTNNTYSLEYTTNYIKGWWADDAPASYRTTHWLTDIDFTDEGNMLLSLSDRIGHRFCNNVGRMDGQNPDLLVVFKDINGNWTLESNGTAGDLTGSGVGNGEGPNGGEFFGQEHWITDPNYHSETALGSIVVLPGSGEVVAMVYDPLITAYSGGVHRYNTSNGIKVGTKQLYTRDFTGNVGKATGFGEVIALCGERPIEVGNYVWLDSNNNGAQDAGESGLGGLELQILDENCTVIGETTTDGKGYYSFGLNNVDRDLDGVFDGLKPNTDYYIKVKGSVDSNTSTYYEINGEQYFVCPVDVAGSNDIDCDISMAQDFCSDQPVIGVTTQDYGMNNHTFDIGLYSPQLFDIALRKELISANQITYGSDVDFRITVYNQGEKIARSVTVTDYLSDAYLFDENKNPGWQKSGNKLTYIYNGDIAPTGNVSVYLKLTADEYQNSKDLLNYAEISGATDNTGPVTSDMDSAFDQIEDNDRGGEYNTDTDDEINDTNISDEDDHDVAGPNVFDLALKIEDKNPSKIYRSNDRVDFNISVYNQGLLDAESYTIINYIPEDLLFVDVLNPGWELDGNKATLLVDGGFKSGASRQVHCISFRVKSGVNVDEIVNVAEISDAYLDGGIKAIDFDSTPDSIKGNDAGGVVNSLQDNLISDHGAEDEDDEDPVVIRLRVVDLALIKRAVTSRAVEGEIAQFSIEVINQGTEPVKKFEVVDYFPNVLDLEDDRWSVSGNKAYRTITMDEVLAPNQSYELDINFRVKSNTDKLPFINYAEIYKVYDVNNVDISAIDYDSTPDDLLTNDAGGAINTDNDNFTGGNQLAEEDDHDPAMMAFITVETLGSCVCASPALGLFQHQYRITAPEGQEWYVDQVLDIFEASPLDGAIPFVTGPGTEYIEEVDNGVDDGLSFYIFVGTTNDGDAWEITLRNNNDDIERLSGAACNGTNILVEGEFSLCSGSTETYTVTNPEPGATYLFTLPSGGTITGSTATSATVAWDNTTGGPHELTVANQAFSTNCQRTTIVGGVGVTVGAADGPMSCIGDVNISLNQFCELLVKPTTIAAGPLDPTAPYSVMLTMPDGSIIPNNLLTSEHIGVPITAKLIEGCGGNSCWATITVEDKLAPIIQCNDTEIVCYNFEEYDGPLAIDACEGVVSTQQTGESIFLYDCHPEFVRKITRTYTASDSKGNTSEPCTIDIYVKKIDVNAISYPEDITGSVAISCDEVELNADGYPTLASTGQPTINGFNILDGLTPLCGIAMDYNDRTVGPIGCTTKVMREFRLVYNTCNFVDNGGVIDSIPVTQIFTYTQTIELEDNDPPVFGMMSDITASAGSGNCEAAVFIPAPSVTDACADDIEVDIRYPGGFANDQSSLFVNLPVGTNKVTYLAYDECGNLDSASIMITVMDMTAPVAVCDVPTAIGINSEGIGYAYASTFDDGSTDACGIVSMQVRRLDDGASCGPVSTEFGEFVVFCCEDVGTTVMVEFQVMDEAGNRNSCMIGVEVQDKFPPAITCPADRTIQCGTPYDLMDLSEFGEAVATDACMVMLSDVASFAPTNNCGEGVITRVFTAEDNNGSVTCEQTITIVNDTPFVLDNITFPPYYETESCDLNELEPENLAAPFNKPILNDDSCDMVSATHSDEVYDFSGDNACFKILRTWTVINWCKMVDGTPETFIGSQTIKVNNSVAPVITENCDPIMECSFDSCDSGNVTLVKTATDDCTLPGNMTWSYIINLESGTTITNNGAGNSIDASGEYELGSHTITYTFLDRCGNPISCIQEFTIANCTPPQAVCNDGLTVELVPMDISMPADGIVDAEMACLFAPQLNVSSSHDCGLPLVYSFSADTSDTKRLFDCSSIGANEVTLWVTDSNGNTDICTTTLIVQDNNETDICPSIEDCVEFPENITVTTCDEDYSPLNLGAMPTVDEVCASCDDYTITFVDTPLDYPNETCALFEREFTVTFNCFIAPMTVEGTHLVYDFDVVAPGISCPPSVTVEATNAQLDCSASVSMIPATFTSNCNSNVTITNDSNFATSAGDNASGNYPVGETIVTFTATDACGNTNTCQTTVTVIDGIAPECNLKDITINVEASGTTIVTFADLDDGSQDGCGEAVVGVSVTPNSFTCADLGANTVDVVIMDASGNMTTCSEANVFVIDTTAPVCSTKDITVSIVDGQTSVSITPDLIDDGTQDLCGTSSLVSVTPNNFTCANLGENTVVLTVTDQNNNSSTCTATVTVVETVEPVCVANDFTVTLGVNGSATVTGDQIGSGSTDACSGIATLDVSPNTFTCENLGDNTVTLTVTDNSGNSCTATSTVTILEDGIPICNAQDITVSIMEGMTSISITPAQVDGGSSDACSSATPSNVTPSTFTCSDLGDNAVTLTVTDASGNTSTCTANVTVVDMIAPVCNMQDITVSLNNNEAVTINAQDLDNGSTDACGTIVSYSAEPDTFTCDDIGDNTVTLTITDNNGNTSTCIANVNVQDVEAPVCITQDITLSLDDNGSLFVSSNQVNNGSFDECGIVQSVVVTPFLFDCDDLGDNVVTLTTTDNSGNSSMCTATITIEDTTAPECNVMDITVSLDSTTGITITGDQLDNGSTDLCSDVTLTVSPSTLTCENLGDNVVTVTTTDESGNSSTCTATVTVEDNTMIECLTQDITINLDENGSVSITPEDIDNGSSAGCSDGVTLAIDRSDFDCNDMSFPFVEVTLTVTSSTGQSTTCTANVTIVDNMAPTITCPDDVTVNCADFDSTLESYGSAALIDSDDNCVGGLNVTEGEVITEIDVCGVGTYTRTFTATDNEGNATSCQQVVTVTGSSDPLVMNDINFPGDITIEGTCEEIDVTTIDGGVVTVDTDNATCTMISITSTDGPVMMNAACTSSFVRTHTVTDACQVDGTGAGVFTSEQTITVTTQAPTITGLSSFETTVTDTMTCTVSLDLSAFNVENCDDNFTTSNDSPFANTNNTADASGDYPVGNHTINLTVTNDCGLSGMYTYTVTVTDTIVLDVICFKFHPDMEPDGMVDVSVYNLVTGYEAFTCEGDEVPLIVSYSNMDENDTIRTVGCDAVLSPVPFTVYFYYEGEVYDSCTSSIEPFDFTDFCGDGLSVTGNVLTYTDQAVPGVMVNLDGSGSDGIATDENGVYAFPSMTPGGEYEVIPAKDDNHTDGVTTLDLILIQRHVLGLQDLDNPYKLIAADINANGTISGIDVIQLRKLVLGIYSEFPDNTSWRMIDADYEFFDATNALDEAFPETYEIDALSTNMKIEFIGVKTGDVNGSIDLGLTESQSSKTRSANTWNLNIVNQKVKAGEEVEVDFKLDRNMTIQGFQMTISTENITDMEISSTVLDIDDNYYNIDDKGRVALSWFDANNTFIKEGSAVITMRITADEDGDLIDMIHINSDRVETQSYADNSIVNDNIEVRWETPDNEFRLFQNNPNPWLESTNINFMIPEAGDVVINVRSVNGQKVKTYQSYFEAGTHTIKVDKDDLLESGVYYYEMRYDNQIVVHKMILMN